MSDAKDVTRKAVKNTSEFQKFDAMMHKLIAVPHGQIKAKLDAEKAAKAASKAAPKK